MFIAVSLPARRRESFTFLWEVLCVVMTVLLAAPIDLWAQTTKTPATITQRPAIRIVGYLPDYRAREFRPEWGKHLTDLVIFSAEPTADGRLDLRRLQNAPWSTFAEVKSKHQVRLILSVGGWERSTHFAKVAATDVTRMAFATDAAAICAKYGLDGIDIDWEHPKTESEQNDYAKLLRELHVALRRQQLSLSVTMAAWQRIPAAAFASVDSIQVMAYDHSGKHSTLDGAKGDVKKVLDLGAPREKVILGVPFYGRDVEKRGTAMTYRAILDKYHPDPDQDEVDSFYFNGRKTIQEKTRFAVEAKLGGVMIWELGQDAFGDASLLSAIREVATQNR